MPVWQNEPPAPTDFAGIRIFRCPANGSTVGIATSERITGCPTHYAHRRTQPCEGPDCPLCQSHGVPRWHGWIAIATMKSHYVAVLELTALAAAPLHEYFQRHGSIRGARITATRIGNKTNSPVSVKVEAEDLDLRTLPKAIDMEKFLETLWHPDARKHVAPCTSIDSETVENQPEPIIPPPANGETAREPAITRGRRPSR